MGANVSMASGIGVVGVGMTGVTSTGKAVACISEASIRFTEALDSPFIGVKWVGSRPVRLSSTPLVISRDANSGVGAGVAECV